MKLSSKTTLLISEYFIPKKEHTSFTVGSLHTITVWFESRAPRLSELIFLNVIVLLDDS